MTLPHLVLFIRYLKAMVDSELPLSEGDFAAIMTTFIYSVFSEEEIKKVIDKLDNEKCL